VTILLPRNVLASVAAEAARTSPEAVH